MKQNEKWFLNVIKDQITPLEFSILPEVYLYGLKKASDFYDIKINLPVLKRINTRLYSTKFHLELTSKWNTKEKVYSYAIDIESKWKKYKRKIDSISQKWKIQKKVRNLNELALDMVHCLEDVKKLSEIHFIITWPASLIIGEFEKFYKKLIHPFSDIDFFNFFKGFQNQTTKVAMKLWEVAEFVKSDDTLFNNFLNVSKIEDLESDLFKTKNGIILKRKLGAFIYNYGERVEKFGLAIPSWKEDPTPVIFQLKQYIKLDNFNLLTNQIVSTYNRKISNGIAKMILKKHSPLKVKEYNLLLKSAQFAYRIREDHQFFIDSKSPYILRRLLYQISSLLIERKIFTDKDDIQMLSYTELLNGIKHNPDKLTNLILKRKKEMYDFLNVIPESVLQGSKVKNTNYEANMLTDSLKLKQAKEVNNKITDLVLYGTAASKGKIVGRAVIIQSYLESEKIFPGCILITSTAEPSLTTLFGIAGAVVTDTGGVLCHCAVSAREYGIPAVLGTKIATQSIRPNQLIEVDGFEGTVRKLEHD